jgi:hypothetical protein
VLSLDPQVPYPHFELGVIFLLQNQPQKALAEMQRESDPGHRELGTVLALSALGRKVEADQALAAFIQDHNDSLASFIAEIYAWRGDVDQAFMWLDTAYEQRDGYLADIMLVPTMASLKSDLRWPAFLDKMGLPH